MSKAAKQETTAAKRDTFRAIAEIIGKRKHALNGAAILCQSATDMARLYGELTFVTGSRFRAVAVVTPERTEWLCVESSDAKTGRGCTITQAADALGLIRVQHATLSTAYSQARENAKPSKRSAR